MRIDSSILKKRSSLEDFEKLIETSSWKLLTLITDHGNPQPALDYLNDHMGNAVDLEMTFEQGRSFLIYAVLRGEIKIVEKLLELKPALLNKQDQHLRSPIHYAVLMKKFKVLAFLVDHGADLFLTDTNGQTPTHLAAQKFNREIYLFLRFRGSSGLLQDNFGLRPVDYIEDEVEYLEFIAMETGTPRKRATRESRVSLQSIYSFEECPFAVKTQFSNPGKEEFNMRRRYFSRLGLFDHRRGPCLPDGYMDRCGGSLLEDDALKSITREPEEESKEHSNSLISEKENKLKSGSLISQDSPLRSRRINAADVQIQGMIGKGNFGRIYAVKVRGREDTFAMKAYGKKEFLLTNLARFLFSEKKIMANFDHPFLVKMHFAFQTSQKLYVLMDYCDKGDLGNQVLRLTDLQIKVLACELVLALKALHDRDIIHRDLKPSNVFIGPDGHVKLGDFGLAKENIKRGSLHYTFCGSIVYLPPEIINRSGHNKTIDWYLLGELLFEMIEGVPPFYGDSKDELYKNILEKELDFKADVSESFKDLVRCLLERDPCQRLGNRYGANEIMSHHYFVGIDWAKVYRKEYPLFEPSSLRSYKPAKLSAEDSNWAKDQPESQSDNLYLPHWSFAR